MNTATIIDTNGKTIGERKVRIYTDKVGAYRVDWDGRDYYFTGKTGTHIATGKPSKEFSDIHDRRLWVTDDLTIITLD